MRTIVIADDFAGANGTAAAFRSIGMSALTTEEKNTRELAQTYDVVVTIAFSKHQSPAETASSIKTFIENAWPVDLISVRIDTTLRGNIGASVQSARETVERLSGNKTIAVVAPAWPAAKRVTVDGYQLLDGLLLEKTGVYNDVRDPVKCSNIVKKIQEQSDLKVSLVPIAALSKDDNYVRDFIFDELSSDIDTIVLDGYTDRHLLMGIRGVLDAARLVNEPLTLMMADTGPGAVIMSNELGLSQTKNNRTPVMLSGSDSALSQVQIGAMKDQVDTNFQLTPTEDDGITPDVTECATLLGKMIDLARPGQVVGLATAFHPQDIQRNLSSEVHERIPRNLAVAFEKAIEFRTIGGFYATGGDVASHLFSVLSATGFEIQKQIEPLSVAGTIIGGPYEGLHGVTKGGLIGDENSGVRIVNYLKTVSQTQAYNASNSFFS